MAASDPPWLPFVPPTIALHGTDTDEPTTDVTIDNTITLFLDVAGFTPLTAALEAHGSAGLEQLQQLLNSFFGRVDRTIESWGGSVIRYEGDAVVATFDRATRLEGAVGAAASILDIANEMAAVETLAGLQGIRAKIGIAAGSVRSLLLDQGDRYGIVVAGPALDAAVEAEHWATPGDLIATPSLASTFDPAQTEIVEADHGPEPHVRLHNLGADLQPPDTLEPRDIYGDLDPNSVMDEIVIDRVTKGLAATDFRVVGSLFVGLDNITELTDLIDATRTMNRIVEEAGGSVLSVASGDKGHKALVTVGAPAAVDEIERRVLTIVDALLSEPTLQLRIGATTSANLAGRLGGSVRADYTILGNGVNMAARLMGLADPGSALVDTVTSSAVDELFSFSHPMDLEVKGRATPMRVRSYTPGVGAPPTSLGRRPSPFVNRRRELDQLQSWALDAAEGRGRGCEIEGPAGIGKTRLVREFIDRADTASYLLSLPRHRRSVGVDALAPLFRWLVGLPDDETPTGAMIDRLLEVTNWDRSREPYLRALLDMPKAEAVDGPSSTNDTELLRSMAVDLVRRRALESATTIVIDGTEGLQGLGKAIIEDIARAAPTLPLLLLSVGRKQPETTGQESILLPELDPSEAQALASSLGESEPVALTTQVGGNPLAIELAIGSGADDLRLTALVGARIESSGEDVATWVREAAVFGEYVPLRSVAEAVGPVPTNLFSSGLLRPDISGDWARFDSDLTREVAYESLMPRRRSTLHHAAGSVLEYRLGHDDAVTPAMVADHFSHTDDDERKRLSFRRAGESAAAAFDLEEATLWFELLAPLVEGDGRREIALNLGGWLTTLGEWNRAEHWFEQATSPEAPQARALAGLAGLRQAQGRHEEALELLAQAEGHARATNDHQGLAEILVRQSDVTWGDRSPEEIEAVIAEMKSLAPVVGDDLLIRADHAEATVNWRLRRNLSEARLLFRRAIAGAELQGNRVLLSELHSDLAGTFYVEERFDEALEVLATGRSHAAAVGYRRAEGAILANEASMLIKLGAARTGLRMCREAALLQVGLGEARFAIINLSVAATVYGAIGHNDEARSILEALKDIVVGQYEGIVEAFVRHHLGRSLLRSGELELALAEVRAVAELAEQLGYHDLDEDQAALEIRIVAASDPLEAQAVLDRRFPDPTPISLYEAWRLDPRRADEARESLRAAFEATPSARLARRLRLLDPPGPLNPREDSEDVVDHHTFLELAARIRASLRVTSTTPA